MPSTADESPPILSTLGTGSIGTGIAAVSLSIAMEADLEELCNVEQQQTSSLVEENITKNLHVTKEETETTTTAIITNEASAEKQLPAQMEDPMQPIEQSQQSKDQPLKPVLESESTTDTEKDKTTVSEVSLTNSKTVQEEQVVEQKSEPAIIDPPVTKTPVQTSSDNEPLLSNLPTNEGVKCENTRS